MGHSQANSLDSSKRGKQEERFRRGGKYIPMADSCQRMAGTNCVGKQYPSTKSNFFF